VSEVLATGRSLSTGAEFPVLWTRTRGSGRIVGLTLGHDGAAHEHEAFRKLLANSVSWLKGTPRTR
jgi:type 1 glutamine amidotransferase